MPDDKYLSVPVQKQAAIYAFRSSFSKKKYEWTVKKLFEVVHLFAYQNIQHNQSIVLENL